MEMFGRFAMKTMAGDRNRVSLNFSHNWNFATAKMAAMTLRAVEHEQGN
jgi:hypothetical protein